MDVDGARPGQPGRDVASASPASLPSREVASAWLLCGDRLYITFAAVLGLAWLWPALGTSVGWGYVLGNASVVALYLGLSYTLRRRLAPYAVSVWVRIVLTCTVLPFCYFQTGEFICATRLHDVAPLEAFLFASDRFILGADYATWIHQIRNPVATEILQVCYASFYFLPLLLAVILLLRGKQRFLPEALWSLAAVFLISYLGYVIFPARSPAFLQEDLAPTGGICMATAIWDHLRDLGCRSYDAFPSGHTAISALLIYGAWRYDRVALLFVGPVATALIVSTLYLQYHFVVDVVAGLALTTGVVLWQRAKRRRITAPDTQP